MSKLTEFRPSDESAVVSRVLLLVHRAIDEEFPSVEPAPKRFAKTVFANTDEPTINQALPQDVQNQGTEDSDSSPWKVPIQQFIERLKTDKVLRTRSIIAFVSILVTLIILYLGLSQ